MPGGQYRLRAAAGHNRARHSSGRASLRYVTERCRPPSPRQLVGVALIGPQGTRPCLWLCRPARRPNLGFGPGVAWPKSRSCGVRAGRAGYRAVPRLPSRATWGLVFLLGPGGRRPPWRRRGRR